MYSVVERNRNWLDDMLGNSAMSALKKYNCKLPKVNYKEDEDRYLISLEMPGLSAEDIEIGLEDGILEISGGFNREESVNDDGYSYREFELSKFKRSFRTPKETSESDILANYQNGILNVEIMKVKQKKKKDKVKIKVK